MTTERNYPIALELSDIESRILGSALEAYAAEEATHGAAGRIVAECAEELNTRLLGLRYDAEYPPGPSIDTIFGDLLKHSPADTFGQ